MQDLKLIGVHEDGEHLLLGGPEGVRFRVRVDEPLRAAVRRDRHHPGLPQQVADETLRPRDVQALVRAGASTEEAAERAGWTVEKVRRFEGPILAEREHVAGLARSARLRGRSGISGAPTLAHRVHERLAERGVDSALADWDSRRAEDGPWTVVVMFTAGGRQREASWHFDLADRTVSAVDDEARWLSEDEHTPDGPLPAPHLSAPGRAGTVYDVEAEGGLRPTGPVDPADRWGTSSRKPASSLAGTSDPTTGSRPDAVTGSGPSLPGGLSAGSFDAGSGAEDAPLDLMTAMRARSTARLRRGSGHSRGSGRTPTNIPGAGDLPDDALPLEDLGYDPETMPPPPGAHADPDPDGVDGRPEPDAVEGTNSQAPDSQARDSQARDSQAPAAADRVAESAPASEGSRAAQQSSSEQSDSEQSDSEQSDPEQSGSEPSGSEQSAPPAQRPRTPRRSGRTSVPAWDEIMFGAKPADG